MHGSDPGSQPGTRHGVSPIVAGIVALVTAGAGLFAGYLLFDDGGAGSADEWSAEVADAHIEYACDITERLDETHPTEDDLGPLGEDPWTFEALAAGSLIRAAAHDPEYEHLEDLGNEGQAAPTRLDFDGWREFVDAYLVECS